MTDTSTQRAAAHPAAPGRPDGAALRLRNVSKSFGALQALRDVRLEVDYGEVHALMGENGAGKSTLMKILSGAYTADPGSTILLDGREVSIDSPLRAAELGIAVIYQELSLAPNLTVAENVFLGREPRRGWTVDRAAMRKSTAVALERLGSRIDPWARVGELSLADRQMVEIARAISVNARILIMDEPTTMLSTQETDGLFAVIRQLRGEGHAIIYISHRMDEIYALSDRCTVLRDGGYVGTLSRDELTPARLVHMMVGRDVSAFYQRERGGAAGARPAIMEVDRLTDGKRIQPATFSLHAGEVLGIAGLVGAGRTELMRLIGGLDPAVSGEVRIEGRKVDIASPRKAIEAGVLYLTEDRKQQGLLLDMSVGDNINLIVCRHDANRLGVLDRRRARARARAAIGSLNVRVRDSKVAVGSLSGGNQQKVLLSRLLEANPKILILDEPTRGVDIGAKTEIYRLIDELARTNIGIVVISSELPELIGLADRVLVLREGAIQGEVGGPGGCDITQEAIMHLATGSERLIA